MASSGWEDALYPAVGFGVLIFYVPLAVAPGSRLSRALAGYQLGPLLVALIYTVQLVARVVGGAGGPAAAGSNLWTLDGARAMFQNKYTLLMGWEHYFCHDLAVANWVATDGQRLGVRWWWRVPTLALCWLFGPCGLLLHAAVRAAHAKASGAPLLVEEGAAGGDRGFAHLAGASAGSEGD